MEDAEKHINVLVLHMASIQFKGLSKSTQCLPAAWCGHHLEYRVMACRTNYASVHKILSNTAPVKSGADIGKCLFVLSKLSIFQLPLRWERSVIQVAFIGKPTLTSLPQKLAKDGSSKWPLLTLNSSLYFSKSKITFFSGGRRMNVHLILPPSNRLSDTGSECSILIFDCQF